MRPTSRASTRSPRRVLVALLGASVLTLGLVACGGGDDSSDDTDHEISTEQLNESATQSTDDGQDQADGKGDGKGKGKGKKGDRGDDGSESPDGGLADELSAVFVRLVDPSLTTQGRADQIAGGSDLGPTLDALGARIGGTVRDVEVTDAEADGDTASGDVSFFGAEDQKLGTVPVTFARVDGEWRLDRDGACAIVRYSGDSCP